MGKRGYVGVSWGASMRPRVFPAEDVLPARQPDRGIVASMRPRVFPAEDLRDVYVTTAAARASMRPRVFPAEDGITPTADAHLATLQ